MLNQIFIIIKTNLRADNFSLLIRKNPKINTAISRYFKSQTPFCMPDLRSFEDDTPNISKAIRKKNDDIPAQSLSRISLGKNGSTCTLPESRQLFHISIPPLCRVLGKTIRSKMGIKLRSTFSHQQEVFESLGRA